MTKGNLWLLFSCSSDPWGVAFLFPGVVSDLASMQLTLAAWAGGLRYPL